MAIPRLSLGCLQVDPDSKKYKGYSTAIPWLSHGYPTAIPRVAGGVLEEVILTPSRTISVHG